MHRVKSNLVSTFRRVQQSIWFFPVLLLIPVILLTILKINGSSIGMYHAIFYGNTKDSSLLLNRPRGIRSDEWVVNTQQVIAQSKAGYPVVNPYIGNGENMTTTDVPYKEWSTLFKPLNIPFFILPLEMAFALKWWLMGYLLIVSCYFFVLKLLPQKRLLASFISVSLFTSAFVQWWYVYGTVSSLFYPLFIAITVMNLYKSSSLKRKIAYGTLLAYLASCFALVLYPPFQIATGIVLGAFLISHILEVYTGWNKQQRKYNIIITLAAGVVSLLIVALFLITRLDVLKTTTETVYPGKRSFQSGGFPYKHFLSPHLGFQFTSENKTGRYLIDGVNPSNQSEASNFLLLLPFLLLPSVVLLVYEKKKNRPLDKPLLLLNLLFIVFCSQLFVHAFTPFSHFLLLDKVGTWRLLIGIGLLNVMVLVAWIRNYSKKPFTFKYRHAVVYSLLVFAIQLLLALDAHNNLVSFISLRGAILFSLPIPIVIFLLLRKKFVLALLFYVIFSVFITFRVNPLYKGLGILTNSPVSKEVRDIGGKTNFGWISDGGYLQNIASINGERSITGVYNYPQLGLWDNIPGATEKVYNRYAHVGAVISDDLPSRPKLKLVSQDSFVLESNPCSPDLKKIHVSYIVTANVLSGKCTSKERTLSYPNTTLYIYKIL